MEQGPIFPSGAVGGLTSVTRRLIAERLAAPLPAPRHRFERPPSDRRPTPAAVLIALLDRPQGLSILLTQRTDHLSHHAGQISFPGGRIEDSDSDPIAAALREAEEEIGLSPARVEVLGRMSDYVTTTGFTIVPVVGALSGTITLTPDPFEVAEIFELPLAFILDPDHHLQKSRMLDGIERFFWQLPFEGRNIWGATAGMLVEFSDLLRG